MPARSAAFVLAVALLLGCAHGRSLKQAGNDLTWSYLYSITATKCKEYNGTKGFKGTSDNWWIASTKPATIDWDKVVELAWRLCAATPTEIASTLLTAFEQPGSEEANLAAAAMKQPCFDGYALGVKYLDVADGNNNNATRLQSYAEKWMQAADAAGFAICLAFGEFDSDGMLVNGTERKVHNPTPWNVTGQPDVTYVGVEYFLPADEPGTPTACQTWNGTDFVKGKKEWPGTVATPATVDPTELQAFVDEICANMSSAASTLISAIESGGDGASLAAMSALFSCPGEIRLDSMVWPAIWPYDGQDWQRSLNLVKAWVNALDLLGYPMCVTQVWFNHLKPTNFTYVHPGGVTAGSVGATRT